MKAVTVELSVAMTVTVGVPDDFEPALLSWSRYRGVLRHAARCEMPDWDDVEIIDHYPAEDGTYATDLAKQIETIDARCQPQAPKGDR
jgi:hypothetical protein